MQPFIGYSVINCLAEYPFHDINTQTDLCLQKSQNAAF